MVLLLLAPPWGFLGSNGKESACNAGDWSLIPVMHRASIFEPTERANKSTTVMQRQEGNFISSALGLKSHPTGQNLTRVPNKGVWRLIYRQFFVSVTGVAGVT